jgi:hypothetical protein
MCAIEDLQKRGDETADFFWVLKRANGRNGARQSPGQRQTVRHMATSNKQQAAWQSH